MFISGVCSGMYISGEFISGTVVVLLLGGKC